MRMCIASSGWTMYGKGELLRVCPRCASAANRMASVSTQAAYGLSERRPVAYAAGAGTGPEPFRGGRRHGLDPHRALGRGVRAALDRVRVHDGRPLRRLRGADEGASRVV